MFTLKDYALEWLSLNNSDINFVELIIEYLKQKDLDFVFSEPVCDYNNHIYYFKCDYYAVVFLIYIVVKYIDGKYIIVASRVSNTLNSLKIDKRNLDSAKSIDLTSALKKLFDQFPIYLDDIKNI